MPDGFGQHVNMRDGSLQCLGMHESCWRHVGKHDWFALGVDLLGSCGLRLHIYDSYG